MGIPAISHPPRILMLYGSVRERSYSRLATEEAGRLLTAMGADVRILALLQIVGGDKLIIPFC
ncbi:NADPH-dependent FMN reductase [Escherichia coli]|uniref:NADPH-dependent FMN reductase n=1 Tax=Escherichia coli TaxID=562 RepID=UPI00345AB5C7